MDEERHDGGLTPGPSPSEQRSGEGTTAEPDGGQRTGETPVPRDGRGCPPGTNRGGGPKTREGRERALANLRNDTSVTHGIYQYLHKGLWPKCAGCIGRTACPFSEHAETCAVAQAVYCDEMEAMLEVPHIRNLPVAKALMRHRARAVAMMERAVVLMAALDFFEVNDNGQVSGVPLLEIWQRLGNQVLSFSKELLITPKDSAQQQLSLEMAAGMDDVKAAVRELRGAIGQQQREEVIDGEFERE